MARWREASPRLRVVVGSAAIGVLGLGLQLPIFDRSVVPMDEGHLAATASRLLAGELLYRDVHTGIFPGVYYATALLFSLFGSDLVVTRWAQLCVNVAVAVCLWRVAVRVTRPLWAALPPLLYLALVVLAFPVLTMLNYSSQCLLLALFALLSLLRYLEGGRLADGLAVGVLVAATALTKQNVGGLVLLAILGGLVWARRGSALERKSLRTVLRPVLIAGAAVSLVAVAFFALNGTLSDLVQGTLLGVGSSQLRFFTPHRHCTY